MEVSPRLSAIAIALPLALAISTTAAHAQEAEPLPARAIGVDPVAVVPIGDYGDVATLGFGALARLDWPLTPQLAVTGRAGVILHLLDDEVMGDASLTFVPIYGGVRYAFANAQQGPYVAGELGITFGWVTVDTGFGTASDSDSELGGTVGAGYKLGRLDLRGSLFFPDLSEVDDLGIMASVGIDVASL